MIISEQSIDEKYIKEDKTISILKANIYAVLIMLPAVAAMIFFYTLANNRIDMTARLSETIIFFGCFIMLIVLHEWLHGFTAHFYCENKWKSIQFGVKQLTPYCHCTELLRIWQYRIVAVVPLILTGILPYGVSLICGNPLLMAISIFMVIGAGGDMMILVLLRKETSNMIVCDHPTLCGCTLYREKN